MTDRSKNFLPPLAGMNDAELERQRARVRLHHFGETDRLVYWCFSCRHGKIFDPAKLRRRLSGNLKNDPVAVLEKRMTCGRCNTRNHGRFYMAQRED